MFVRCQRLFQASGDQPRPIYLKRPFGTVGECVVYVRQGSTNAPLEPDRWPELFHLVAPDGGSQPTTNINDVRQLVGRWIDVFERHGVKHQQIPLLLPAHYLPLPALADWRQLADLLTGSVIDDTCRLFNIRRDWLEGDSDQIYDGIPLIFDVRGLLSILETWVLTCDEVDMLGFRETRKPLEDFPQQRCAFMLRGIVQEFGEKPVFKYQPLYAEFNWDYDKGRLIAKIAWLAARLTGCGSAGRRLNRSQIEALCSGTVFPDTILTHPWVKEWYPEDFTYSATESKVAKEAGEIAWVEQVAREYDVLETATRIGRIARDRA